MKDKESISCIYLCIMESAIKASPTRNAQEGNLVCYKDELSYLYC
jgi:hypothetical protein